MDVRELQRVRAAIRGVLEGQLGPVRLKSGMFEAGAFAEMPLEQQKTLAKNTRKALHWFDVSFGPVEEHVASNISNLAASNIEAIAVEISVITHKRTTLTYDSRTALLDQVLADGHEAVRALGYPPALESTIEGDATRIVSGVLLGPNGSNRARTTKPSEHWADNLVMWSIVGIVLLDLQLTEPS